MYISPGDYQFIAWIDVNKNGIVDSGDYYAETPVLEVEPGDGWRWMDEIAEVIMVTEDLEAAIANNRGEAVRIH